MNITPKSFFTLTFAEDVALILGTTYTDLAKIFYKTPARYRYRDFLLPKKAGGFRQIRSPNKKIKCIQRKLAKILQQIFEPKPATHGFIPERSIATNAARHLDKRYIFNLDLQNFFDSIHFGRVRNLFMSKPYELPHAPATVLAQICCFDNALPQGAPTSPIVTNLICRKLDAQLQNLAKRFNATYTRYADDISFSFTCRKNRLPRRIVKLLGDTVEVGVDLRQIIESNGFKINDNKSRLDTRCQRLEVTGLTVNEFVNVKRSYVRKTGSMLYAWEKFGYAAAKGEFLKRYDKQRASNVPPEFRDVVKGRLAFLHMIRGKRSPVYIKLAKRFNKLAAGQTEPLPYVEESDQEKLVSESLWVIEVLYDTPDGSKTSQGTGFFLNGIGFVTAAHVVAEKDEVFDQIDVFRHNEPHTRYTLKLSHFDQHRDLAFGALLDSKGVELGPPSSLPPSPMLAKHKERVILFGFPAYKLGTQTPYVVDGKVALVYTQNGIDKFEINTQIRDGNSGGPILNENSQVVGVALEGAEKGGGSNAVIQTQELFKSLEQKSSKNI